VVYEFLLVEQPINQVQNVESPLTNSNVSFWTWNTSTMNNVSMKCCRKPKALNLIG